MHGAFNIPDGGDRRPDAVLELEKQVPVIVDFTFRHPLSDTYRHHYINVREPDDMVDGNLIQQLHKQKNSLVEQAERDKKCSYRFLDPVFRERFLPGVVESTGGFGPMLLQHVHHLAQRIANLNVLMDFAYVKRRIFFELATSVQVGLARMVWNLNSFWNSTLFVQ